MILKSIALAIGLTIGGLLPTLLIGTLLADIHASKELVGGFVSFVGFIAMISVYQHNSTWKCTLQAALIMGLLISTLIYYVSTLAIMY